MKLGQIMKFFYDNNIIIRTNNDLERCKYLTFLAAVYLGLDGVGVIENNMIVMEDEFEDYDFSPEVVKLLHCTNYTYGFDVGIKKDSGFTKLLDGHDSCAYPYKQLADLFEHSKSITKKMTANYYDQVSYYNGTNTFFIDINIEINDEVQKKLDSIRDLNQCTFFVTSYNGKLVIW